MRTIICTAEHPWSPGLGSPPGTLILHPDAQEIDYVEVNADTAKLLHVTRYCPNCKFEWKQEVPE